VEIVADPTVEPGGCIVESGETRIDAQISSTLANVADALGISATAVGNTVTPTQDVDAGRIPPDSRTTSQEAPAS
jgi:antitoxin component of RelBE/YafQ-DinJ toxin-antitoxin module